MNFKHTLLLLVASLAAASAMEEITLEDGRKLVGTYDARAEMLTLMNEKSGKALGTIPLPQSLVVKRSPIMQGKVSGARGEPSDLTPEVGEPQGDVIGAFGQYTLHDGRVLTGAFDPATEKMTIIDAKTGKSFGALHVQQKDIKSFAALQNPTGAGNETAKPTESADAANPVKATNPEPAAKQTADQLTLHDGRVLIGNYDQANEKLHIISERTGQVLGNMPVLTSDIKEQTVITLAVAEASNDPHTLNFSKETRMSVTKAYASIPHRMVRFQSSDPSLPQDDIAYLTTMFGLIDQAVVLRTSPNSFFVKSNVGQLARHNKRYERLIEAIEAVEAPSHLTTYHGLIVSAAKDQAVAYKDSSQKAIQLIRSNRGGTFNPAGHPKARSASSALKRAWGELKRAYPKRTGTNEKAFFDYHCAMDYL